MPSLNQYMAQYDHEHTNPWNKVMHAIGIPIIIAGIILLCITWWRIGLALFIGGWILLFAGHRIEGNKPAFFQSVVYFLVGPGSPKKSKTRSWAPRTGRHPRSRLVTSGEGWSYFFALALKVLKAASACNTRASAGSTGASFTS